MQTMSKAPVDVAALLQTRSNYCPIASAVLPELCLAMTVATIICRPTSGMHVELLACTQDAVTVSTSWNLAWLTSS